MKKTTKLTLARQQLILHWIINTAHSTEKSRGTFYTQLVELLEIPLCYKCLRALKVGQLVTRITSGSRLQKYYHDICERSLWQ